MVTMREIKLYHGTDGTSAAAICKSKRFKLSTKNYEWLGTGIYFWEHESDGEWWALQQAKRKNDSAIVLHTTLSVDSSCFLDLDDPKQMKIFEDEMCLYMKEMEKFQNFSIKFRDKHQLQRFVCDYYKKLHGIDLIAYTFPVFNEKTDMAKVYFNRIGFPSVPHRRQYCATNNDIIQRIEPREVRDYAI